MKETTSNLFNLKNKIVVVTGGAGFLGSQFSSILSDIGAIPIILDINEESIKFLKKKFIKKKQKGIFYLVDLNDEKKVNSVVNLVIKKHRKIDCLINAAGFTGQNMLKTNSNYFEKFEKYDFDLWQKSLSGNLSSIFIVNIASDVGVISPDHRIYEANKKFNYKGTSFNTPIAYSVAKAGIISMTRYLATHWAKKGIRVNCISPAGVYKKHDKKFVEQLSQRIPLGRMAKPHELNGAIVYLCSNASSFVTGHNLIVDGGRTIW